MNVFTRISNALVVAADVLEGVGEGRIGFGDWTLMSGTYRRRYAQSMLNCGAEAALREGRNPYAN